MFDGIKERFKDYIDTKLQLYQLTIEEKMIGFGTLLFYIFLLLGLMFVSLCFVLVFIAKIINAAADNEFLGYGIVATLCLFLLWLMSRTKSRTMITNEIKNKYYQTLKNNSMETKSRSPFDYDNEKAALIKKSNTLENNLDFEMSEIKGYLQEYGKNIAIITGSLVATYLVAKLITKSSSKNGSVVEMSVSKAPVVHYIKEKNESSIARQIRSSIALFLMSVAKQKLMDYLNKNLAKSE